MGASRREIEIEGDLVAVVPTEELDEPEGRYSRDSENDTIALFPQEWLRDPASPFLQSGYHDVPWDEPELIRSCARKRHKKGEVEFQRTPLQNLSAVRLPRL